MELLYVFPPKLQSRGWERSPSVQLNEILWEAAAEDHSILNATHPLPWVNRRGRAESWDEKEGSCPGRAGSTAPRHLLLIPSWPNSLLTVTGQDKPKSWQFPWKWMSVLTLQSTQELLGYSSTGMGRRRKEGKRRAGSVHHGSWPCYLHPLTKGLGRALQQAQRSMDELTLAELPLLYGFSYSWQEGSPSTWTKSHQVFTCLWWISKGRHFGLWQSLALFVFVCYMTTLLTENRFVCPCTPWTPFCFVQNEFSWSHLGKKQIPKQTLIFTFLITCSY